MVWVRRIALAVLVLWLLASAAVLLALLRGGFSVRHARSPFETSVALALRNAAVPASLQKLVNPLASDPEAWRQGADHFREECALCHGRDGRGRIYIAQHLDPVVPDLSGPRTQRLSDGALYAVIMNGVRWTGMPAWSEHHTPEETWKLVSFIRKIPSLPPEPEREEEESAPAEGREPGEHRH